MLESGWGAFLLYHAAVLGWLVVTRRWRGALGALAPPRRRDAPAGAPASRATPTLATLGILAGIGGAALMWWLWPWYAGRSAALAPALAALGLHGTAWPLFTIYHALVNPFVEEVYWRGALGEGAGVLRPSDGAFAAYHAIVLVRFTGALPISLSLVALTFVAAFWRWTYRRSGSLWPAVLAHLAADAGIMWVAFRMAR